jgi:hypothetical protein
MKLDHWFYRGNTGPKQQDTRDLFKLQQTPNLCELYTEVYNMQQQSSHLRNKLHIVLGQSSAKKEWTDSGRSEEKCRKRKEKPKSLQVAGTLVPRQKATGCCAREKAASKSHLVGRWKTQSALGDATFVLPSVSCRILRSRVFIY